MVVELLGYLALLGQVNWDHHYVLLVYQGETLSSKDGVFPKELELKRLVERTRLLVIEEV